ncbi:MAG: DUF2970 domain-containing protein [Oceanospirillales bacterium]|uniref:DUF2970 family protein n=1 Tax=Marinobacterium halophilum TaxID=267374 RepID=A0A2P8ELC9_9GAMM|nr:DUF2970 domain-containing protein [Marinobacterium halophilum]MBR9829287.1 DUF2970 domain-containing protein [Oceanospirillales bacterium]PSL10280.1 Protein of unknown function (DUF2970) [Marinobacterium halophilum]
MSDKPTLWQTLLSVLSGFFGVQSERNRERDFRNGRPLYYILTGLLMAGLFVVGVILLVRWALSLAGV